MQNDKNEMNNSTDLINNDTKSLTFKNEPVKKRGRPPNIHKVGHQKKTQSETKAVSPQILSSAPSSASLSDDSRANRPKRKPVGVQRRLSIPAKPGYYTRIVTVKRGNGDDLTARKVMFEEAGYVVRDRVNEMGDSPSKDPSIQGSNLISLGRGDYGVVMDIPLEDYKHDQEQKVKRNNERLQAVKRFQPNIAGLKQYGEIKTNDN